MPTAGAALDPLPLLRIALTRGIGPVLARRLIDALGSPDAALAARPADLRAVQGIGEARAGAITRSLTDSARLAEEELALAERLAVRIVPMGDTAYPAQLALLPDAPIVLYVRGDLPPEAFRIAIVGSRRCTAYGEEQAERFASAFAQAGLSVVSGGARGIDSAAHRACARLNAPTLAVLGCGLSNCYPPENAPLFDDIVSAGGAILSELPLRTAPSAENFPARNRIIAGLSLGVVVIEAPRGSGALITARLAAESYGREVFALPGRVDSPASEGSNELIRDAGAHLITSPRDAIDLLEPIARHQHQGTFADRFALAESNPAPRPSPLPNDLSPSQSKLVEALTDPRTVDDLCRATALAPETIQADLTVLEIRRVVTRSPDGRVRVRK